MIVVVIACVAVTVYAAVGITVLLVRTGALRWNRDEVSDR